MMMPNSEDIPTEENPEPVSEQNPDGMRRVAVEVESLVKKTWVTYSLLGITIFVYLLQMASQALLGADVPAYFGAKVNQFIYSGQLWRFLSPMFLHGSLLHIGFNMYALYIFGPRLERHYGHNRFAVLYVLGAFCGNVFSFLLSLQPSLGASTAIFGLVAAEGVFVYRNKLLFGKNAKAILINIFTIVGINLVLGLSPGIDNWGHLGGLIGGFCFAWFAGPEYVVENRITRLVLKDTRNSTQVVVVTGLVVIIMSGLVILRFMTSAVL